MRPEHPDVSGLLGSPLALPSERTIGAVESTGLGGNARNFDNPKDDDCGGSAGKDTNGDSNSEWN